MIAPQVLEFSVSRFYDLYSEYNSGTARSINLNPLVLYATTVQSDVDSEVYHTFFAVSEVEPANGKVVRCYCVEVAAPDCLMTQASAFVMREGDIDMPTSCPPVILDKLSNPENDIGFHWRKSCLINDWKFEIRVYSGLNGKRTITVNYTHNNRDYTLESRHNISDPEFEQTYEEVIMRYASANIRAVNA